MRSAKIIGIKKIGTKQSIDIEVDSNEHVFYANNIATSNSHAIAYSKMAYWSAWVKYHYAEKFFKNWLRNADEKIDPDLEKRQLIVAAKSEDIKVFGPTIKILEENFSWQNGAIYFGICNVKNVGSIHLAQLKSELSKIEDKTWVNILINVLPNVNKKAVENLISVGAFAGFGKSRTEMLHEYHCYMDLTDKEMDCIQKNINTEGLKISDVIEKFLEKGLKKNGGFISVQSRLDKVENILLRLRNPGRSLVDNSIVYAKIEEKLLGYAINHSELNSCSDASQANTTCKEIVDGKCDPAVLAVIIKRVKEHKTKNGDFMAFLSVEDDSGELENIVVFPDMYEQNRDIIYEQATVLMSGQIKDKERNSFIIDKLYTI